MNFWQWLFGYSDEDVKYFNSINRKKWSDVKSTKKKDWKEEVDKNSEEEYEMCQWYIDHKRKGK